ncbi:TIGR02300 family protein [Coralliovum pocilloporae]|uniref:TIGR02300 family protein n=1 Tax=Coralliovum pocilloporae TaxID=3066369 RepID=UPI003307A91C
MAKPELGTKRTCLSCSAKFYDLQKSPIFCPKCGSEFEVATAAVSSVTPATASKATESDDDEDEDDASGPEIISLEEADAEQGADDDDGEDIPDLDGEDDVEDIGDEDDDTFLEDDDDDNVPFIPEVGGKDDDEG